MNAESQQLCEAFHAHGVTALYHLTTFDNLATILSLGCQPKNRLERLGVVHRSIAEPTVQQRRAALRVTVQCPGSPRTTRPVHDLVPLFFEPRNPMMYRLRAT